MTVERKYRVTFPKVAARLTRQINSKLVQKKTEKKFVK